MQVARSGRERRRYEPAMSSYQRDALVHDWRRALERARA
jgi:hypothetical protein